MSYSFDGFEKDTLTKPRDKAWDNWFQFKAVGDKVQGYIRDVFYRPAEFTVDPKTGEKKQLYKEARGITLEQVDGTLVNVSIKRYAFILSKTNNLRLGDPLTIVFEKELPAKTRGYNPTKQFAFYGVNLPENSNAGNPTVYELDEADRKTQQDEPVTVEDEDEKGDTDAPDMPTVQVADDATTAS